LALLDLALAGGRSVEADDVLVAAVGEHLAVNSLGAADGLLSGGAGGGGAVHGAFEGLADFVFVFGLLNRGIEQDADKNGGAEGADYANLGFAIWHRASFIGENYFGVAAAVYLRAAFVATVPQSGTAIDSPVVILHLACAKVLSEYNAERVARRLRVPLSPSGRAA